MKFLRDFFKAVPTNSLLLFSSPPKPLSFSSAPPPPPPSAAADVVSSAVSILKHHRSKSRWSHLRSLIAAANDSRLSPSQFSQTALQLRNNPHLVLRFFHFTLTHSLASHSLSSYATVTHILARSRMKSRALNVIKSAMCAFSEDNRAGPVAILDALAKTYRVCDSAPFVFDLLVKACLEGKKIDVAIEIYRILRSKRVFLRTSTCNALVEMVSKSRGCFEGYDLYREIFCGDVENVGRNGRCGKGIVPNANTLNVVMVGFYREGLVDELEEVWEELVGVGCVPNVYSFCVLMAAYCDDGRMEDAMRVWKEMGDKGLNRDVVAYNTIIGGFCGVGEVGKAEEIYREMAMEGLESSCITFEHLIQGYCKVGNFDSVMMLYKDMCRKGFSPESSTVNAIIRSLFDTDDICAALEFWRMAVKNHGTVLEKENYEKLIRGLCLEDNMEEALNLQAEMVVKGFNPNSEIYGAFIDGYVKKGNETMANKLRKERHRTQVS